MNLNYNVVPKWYGLRGGFQVIWITFWAQTDMNCNVGPKWHELFCGPKVIWITLWAPNVVHYNAGPKDWNRLFVNLSKDGSETMNYIVGPKWYEIQCGPCTYRVVRAELYVQARELMLRHIEPQPPTTSLSSVGWSYRYIHTLTCDDRHHIYMTPGFENTTLHSSWAISVKGIAIHISLAHTNLVAFMCKHFSLLQTREWSKVDNSNVYVQPSNSTTQQNNFEVTPMWSHLPWMVW